MERQFEDVPEHGGIDGYTPTFVDVDGIRTRYYDVGRGEPLVLVHGGNWRGTSSANRWSACFEYLREEFRVLAFDRIGCGMTDNPPTPEAFRYDAELEHALGFLDALDVDACHLVGYSRGAGLASRMAVEQPDRFETLGLTNSMTLGPPSGDGTYRHDRVFETDARGLDPVDPAYTRYVLEQYSYRTGYVTDERCRTAAYMQRREKAQQTAAVMDEEGQLEAWLDSLDEHMAETRARIGEGVLSMPVLYVYGRNDLTVPTEMAVAAFDLFAQSTPDVRLTVVNECGHMVFLEHPREFARRVVEFVDFWRDGDPPTTGD